MVRHIPSWASFSTSSAGEYLGIWIRLGAGAKNWVKPFGKPRGRTCKIAGAHIAAAGATELYRVFLSSTLVYVGQVPDPPESLWAEKRELIHSLLKLPPNTFASIPFRDLRDIVGLNLPSLRHLFVASEARL